MFRLLNARRSAKHDDLPDKACFDEICWRPTCLRVDGSPSLLHFRQDRCKWPHSTRHDRGRYTGRATFQYWLPILDFVAPFWHEALKLAARAIREAFSSFVFFGLDVALTNESSLLIEINSAPVVFYRPLLDDAPIGHTAFPRIALQYTEYRSN
ncbi:hypothetical protein [Methylomonas fluvii]|uniref:ATP-grasp domain-containing protein n=1 Tax=Methylomonas fluvii TaxID=1854564 RepID=A0ABR9DHP4_9GAMM|nr:hypothetical protein [Methylomonas fluvii]MBD9362440.1 hypothetical protein [Methylomonas fluvii]